MLEKINTFKLPQCRNDIILTDNQKLILRNNLQDINSLPLQISNNVTVHNFQESRGFILIDI